MCVHVQCECVKEILMHDIVLWWEEGLVIGVVVVNVKLLKYYCKAFEDPVFPWEMRYRRMIIISYTNVAIVISNCFILCVLDCPGAAHIHGVQCLCGGEGKVHL